MKKIIKVTFVILIGVTFFVVPCFGGVIKGCYQKNNGQLRILLGTDKCNPSEQYIEWNTQGEKGPKGDKGDQGIQGPPGATPTLVFADTSCPPGTSVIGFDSDGACLCSDGSTCANQPPPPPPMPQTGDLIITELNVVGPKLAAHQWIEIFNRTDKSFTFEQLDFALTWKDDQGMSHLATTTGFSIGPNSFRVLAFRPAVLASDFGITNTVQIVAPYLSEVGDGKVLGGLGMQWFLIIGAGGGSILLDQVFWMTAPFSESESLVARQLDPDAFTAALNDYVNIPGELNACPTPTPLSGKCVWCSATMLAGSSTTAYGTPGYPNTDCLGINP